MAANTSPIYSSAGDIQWASAPLIVQNQALDGTGTVATVFSSSISGSYVQRIRFKASGSTTTATVARIFINNGNDNTTASNNVLFDEITLPVVTGTQTASTTVFEIPMNIALPPAYRINATVGTTQISGGWFVSAVGGSYLPI